MVRPIEARGEIDQSVAMQTVMSRLGGRNRNVETPPDPCYMVLFGCVVATLIPRSTWDKEVESFSGRGAIAATGIVEPLHCRG